MQLRYFYFFFPTEFKNIAELVAEKKVLSHPYKKSSVSMARFKLSTWFSIKQIASYKQP